MKKFALLATAAVALTLGIAGCSTQYTDDSGQRVPRVHYTFVQDLPDGRSVLCIWAVSGRGGGLDCDWDSAKSGGSAQ